MMIRDLGSGAFHPRCWTRSCSLSEQGLDRLEVLPGPDPGDPAIDRDGPAGLDQDLEDVEGEVEGEVGGDPVGDEVGPDPGDQAFGLLPVATSAIRDQVDAFSGSPSRYSRRRESSGPVSS